MVQGFARTNHPRGNSRRRDKKEKGLKGKIMERESEGKEKECKRKRVERKNDGLEKRMERKTMK